MIWIEQNGMKMEDQLFVDSEYLFDIQSNNIILERDIERRWSKLSPSEVSDVRFGRSIYHLISIHTF